MLEVIPFQLLLTLLVVSVVGSMWLTVCYGWRFTAGLQPLENRNSLRISKVLQTCQIYILYMHMSDYHFLHTQSLAGSRNDLSFGKVTTHFCSVTVTVYWGVLFLGRLTSTFNHSVTKLQLHLLPKIFCNLLTRFKFYLVQYNNVKYSFRRGF